MNDQETPTTEPTNEPTVDGGMDAFEKAMAAFASDDTLPGEGDGAGDLGAGLDTEATNTDAAGAENAGAAQSPAQTSVELPPAKKGKTSGKKAATVVEDAPALAPSGEHSEVEMPASTLAEMAAGRAAVAAAQAREAARVLDEE